MSPFPEAIIIKTACATKEEAAKIATVLLDKNLIAAGQIKKIRSLYLWQGERFDEEEWELSCFTINWHYPQAAETIKENHSYTLPEIIALNIDSAPEEYRDWIEESVKISPALKEQ